MPPSSRVEYLFYRYYKKDCTDAEKAELMLLLQRSEHEAEVKALIDRVLYESKVKYQLPEDNADQILAAILEAVPERGIQPVSRRWKPWAIAASIAAVTAMGIYIWFASLQQPEKIAGRLAEGQHIAAGSDKALLTLDDGMVIDLEAAESGRLDARAGILLNKEKGQLVYQPPSGTGEEGVYNTITTPQGGQYQVVLPDGSNVWLNARSSLRFPTAFTGKERSVRLEGEGYFEVTPNKTKPFRVRSGETEIEVLGTHFNLKTYANEPAMEATLLEGAVRVSREGEARVVQPGQQVRLLAGQMKVVPVDTSSIVAWKNGFFQFNNASLKSIMRQVERWYDVRIDYASIPDKRYNGTVLRSSNLSEVLTMLELAGSFRFEVKNKTVKVIN